jgi:hypothetical protein
MKRIFSFLLFLFLSLVATGCGFVAEGPFGYLYTETTTSVAVGPAESGEKMGQACVTSFFGMIAIGNASIETAMTNGGIEEIFTVNKNNFSVMGLYSRQCTVVRGT